MQPTVFRGHDRMRIVQEEIVGPVLPVTTFRDDEEALSIANDSLYGLGAGDASLGAIGGAEFFIGGSQDAVRTHTRLIIDGVPGRGGMVSLESGSGQRFLLRSRVFDEAGPRPSAPDRAGAVAGLAAGVLSADTFTGARPCRP